MASSKSMIDYLLGQLGPQASAKAMFGEYGIYMRGIMIGLFCDSRFFLKPTDAARQMLEKYDQAPPYPGAKPAIVIPEELWDDNRLMSRLANATADLLAGNKRVHRSAK
jgi:Regulator of competence-specific genes